MIEQRIYTRNATGALIEVVYVDRSWVSYFKLHQQTRERIGSIVRERANKFLVRYA